MSRHFDVAAALEDDGDEIRVRGQTIGVGFFSRAPSRFEGQTDVQTTQAQVTVVAEVARRISKYDILQIDGRSYSVIDRDGRNTTVTLNLAEEDSRYADFR